jgi:hypothetical protein
MGVFMRLATFVVGICFAFVGSASEASDSARGFTDVRSATLLADGSFSNHASPFGGAYERHVDSPLYDMDDSSRNGAVGLMGYVPSQNPASFALPRLPAAQPHQEASARWNPAVIPLPATRTLEDHLLTGFVALMLIAYQLRRKHRFLRPHQFST